MSLAETKAALAKAQERYIAVAETEPAAVVRAAAQAVTTLKSQLVDYITEGANVCPRCGQMPHGIEQPRGRNDVEFEIGCSWCKPFIHTDGTVRECRVRGGMLPRHTVEAWNEGPDYWRQASPAVAEAILAAAAAEKAAAEKLAGETVSSS